MAKTGGQNKKTMAELQLAGTVRRDRHGDPGDQVEFADGLVHKPKGLSENAEQAWLRAVNYLREVDQLKKCYESALAGYAVFYGKLLDDPSAFTAHDATQMRQFITELGFGPVASTRLRANQNRPPAIPDEAAADDFGDL